MEAWCGRKNLCSVLLVIALSGLMSCENENNNQSNEQPTDTTSKPVTKLTNSHSIVGTVSGLTGQLGLQLNGSNDLIVSDNGHFAFPILIEENESYDVTISTLPEGQICTIKDGRGKVSKLLTPDPSILCFKDNPLTRIGQIGGGLPTKVVIQGSYAYLATTIGLHILDISNSANPVSLAFLKIPDTFGSNFDTNNLYIDSHFVYLIY